MSIKLLFNITKRRQLFIVTVFLNFAVTAFAAPGELDPAFGGAGKVISQISDSTDFAAAVAIQPDGKIVVAGEAVNAGTDDFFVARYNSNGTLDPTFGSGGKVVTDFNNRDNAAYAVALQSDGKIVAGGYAKNASFSNVFALARYNPNGTLDTTFGVNGRTTLSFTNINDVISSVIILPDGKILAAGSTFVNTLTTGIDFSLARFNADGTLDTTFADNGKLTTAIGAGNKSDYLRDAKLQPDGKIVAAGYSVTQFTTSDGDMALVRYNPNGTLDASFGSNGKVVTDFQGGHDEAQAVVIQPDGKIVAGGLATTSTIYDFALARYNPDGTLDPAFDGDGKVTTSFSTDVDLANDLLLQPNGKLVAVGQTALGSGNFALARYNANGSLDATFDGDGRLHTAVGSSEDAAYAAALQPDGKILAVGYAIVNNFLDTALVRYQGDTPRPSRYDFDGDRKAEVSVFRPSNGTWYLNRSTGGFTGVQFGAPTDKIAPADFDGDGRTDIAVFRDGTWYWLASSTGGFNAVQFGTASDIPVPADYTGDGRAELAVYRSGIWYTLNLVNNEFQAVQFGNATDKPVPADFDADGKTDFAVYRDGTWYLLRSSQGFTGVQFGNATDKPIVEDYDGDGRADPAVFRSGTWYILASTQGFSSIQFGAASDIPVPADYDGDGKTDAAVFRDGVWYMQRSQQGFGAVQFGAANDRPIPAAFVP